LTGSDHYGPDGWQDGRPGGTPFPREVVAFDQVCQRLPQGATLVDVGCGAAFTFAPLRRRRPDLTLVGVDGSPWQLSDARARMPDAALVRGNLDQGGGLPLASGSVDGVYAAEIIEHLVDPDRLLEECRRVLRPGGVLVITTPNLAAWFNRMLLVAGTQPIFVESSARSAKVGAGITRRLRESDKPVFHVRVMTAGALTDLLARHGFTVESVESAPFDRFPGPLRRLDRAVGRLRPTLGSILVVAASC
jgi:SAM-dependent methyltransferase